MVGVTAGSVELAGSWVLVGFGIAVGTAPTGCKTFLTYDIRSCHFIPPGKAAIDRRDLDDNDCQVGQREKSCGNEKDLAFGHAEKCTRPV
jgi:hypothetical protein